MAKKLKKVKTKKYTEIVVFGCGRFGSQIIEDLAYLQEYKIIAVDINQENLKTLPKNVTTLVVGDSSNEQFIDELGVENADVFVVGIGSNIQASLLTSVILRKKFPSSRIIAKAVSNDQEAILKQLGVTEIINPEKAGAKKALVKLLNPLFVDGGQEHKIGYIQEIEGGMSLVRLKLDERYFGKKVKECNLPKEITIALVYRNSKPHIVYGDFKFQANDEILIMAENSLILNYLSNIE